MTSVLNITDYNNRIVFYTPGLWQDREVIVESEEFIEQRNSNQNKFYVEQVNNKGLEIKEGLNTHQFSELEEN